jgi:putative spermidine/putrescine transport system substrate-binding protein
MRFSRHQATLVALALGVAVLPVACAQGGSGKADVSADTLAGSTVGAVTADALKGTKMTYVSYGGTFQDGQEEAFVRPFAQESGASVLTDSPTDRAKIKAQVDSGNVVWDAVDSPPAYVAAECGKLFEKLDYDIIDTSKLPKSTPRSDCYVPSLSYGYGFFYNAEKYQNDPPQDWADFFDTKKYPGKRAIDGRSAPTPGVLEAALLAEGVPASKLYPLDIDKALKKWSTIKSSAITWKTGAQQTQMAESGAADMVFAWSGRIYEANQNGAHFKPVWKNSFTLQDVFAVVKGSKNKNASMALINYALGSKQQAKMSELTSYSPVNTDAKPQLSKDAADFNTTSPEVLKDAIALDYKYWGDNLDEISAAWTKWLNQ